MSTKQIALVGNWTSEDMQTMKDTLAVGTNDSQFQLFLRTAHASGLNPFLNHIYAITYQGKMSLQIGIEGISYLAKKVDGYLGYDAQVVCANDEFRAKRFKDDHGRDNWEITEHEIGFPRGKIIGAYAIAYREGFRPFTVLIDWDEVSHFQTSSIPNQVTMWKKYTADMFKKHCGKRALKGQFGIDINEDDVVSQEPSIDNMPTYERQDITPAETQNATVEVPKQTKPRNTKEAETTAVTKPTDEQIKAARNMITKNFELLQITEKSDKAAYIVDKLNVTEGTIPTYEQQKELLDIMAKDIEKAMTGLPEDLE